EFAKRTDLFHLGGIRGFDRPFERNAAIDNFDGARTELCHAVFSAAEDRDAAVAHDMEAEEQADITTRLLGKSPLGGFAATQRQSNIADDARHEIFAFGRILGLYIFEPPALVLPTRE